MHSEKFVGSFAQSKTFMQHGEDFMATAADCRGQINLIEVCLLLAQPIFIFVFWKNLNPLQAES